MEGYAGRGREISGGQPYMGKDRASGGEIGRECQVGFQAQAQLGRQYCTF